VAYPGLVPYLDSGEIVHFQLHLGQASESDFGIIVEGLLGVRWEALDFVHIGFDCRTYSWAAVSKCQHRSSEGAAITILAQEYDKILSMLARLVLRLVRCKPTAMVTFENPNHGSFKSNAVVQSLLRRPGWWMVVFDYCAMAREEYDGAISGPADHREGGLTAQKTSVMVVYGIGDDPEEGLLRCAGKKCRMVVPGTKRHAVL
jgi:hypothetical protein